MLHLPKLGWLDNKTWLFITLLSIGVPLGLAATGPNFTRMAQLAEQRYGFDSRESVDRWQSLIEQSDAEESAILIRVNQFFNQRIRFDSDLNIWGLKDYWATPLQTLGKQQGDCEDFSIAKYMTLILMGVPSEQLRLVYVKAAIGGAASRTRQAHMVVAYYSEPNTEPLILDNLVGEILPAGQRPDLKPIYSFNSSGLWVGGATAAVAAKPEQRLSLWRDVLSRMQEEGL